MAGLLIVLAMGACDTEDFLTTAPPTILTDEQLWTDPNLILGVLANFYSRAPDFYGLDGAAGGDVPFPFVHHDEALFSGNTFSGDAQANQIIQYDYSWAAEWTDHYDLIRDIHVAIDGIEAATSGLLTPSIKEQFNSELRFLRAWTYFDLVKRMGGVPILTSQVLYDFSGDPSSLQQPRNTEAEVYDFIASEMDAIASTIGNVGSQSRANRYAALALKSRAMLYAGSLARHNSEMAGPITLPGGEVGISGSLAAEYYQKSLDASEAIINSGAYSLVQGDDPGQAFFESVTIKSGNPEVIWAKDFDVSGGRTHIFTLSIVPPSLRLDAFGGNQGSTISPALQLVETFDFLDGSEGTLRGVRDAGANGPQSDWIFYDNPEDVFADKDARLWGTIIYPGASARGGEVQIQAGVAVWNGSSYDLQVGVQGQQYSDGGILTGFDGPIAVQSHVGTTGFYLRKYQDPAPAAATGATQSDVWWVRFRLGEIYMNAAEAAFELGQTADALEYVNALRERAGFPANSLSTLDREKIRSERWAELAFEGHRFWDLKRWRIAHLIWDGSNSSRTANIYSLWGYRVVGGPNDGKYVYDKKPSERQGQPRFWRLGNYYSEIPGGVRGNNPNLVANPFH